MGIPRRNGAGAFQVSIRPLVKTSPEEAGIGELNLADGTRVVALAHMFWPSHDRSLVQAVKNYLAAARPDVIVILGGALHEEAFKQVVDEQDEVSKLLGTKSIPEIAQIRETQEGMEDRFLALAKAGGQFIADFAAVSGAHVFYIPSVTGMLPNEIDIMRFVLTQKERLDAWAEKHPDEAVQGPDIPKDFSEFLGLKGNPNVTVMPFGSALLVNNDTLFIVGDFRRRHPGSAAQVEWEQRMQNIVRSFDGKVSSTWWTTPVHSLPHSVRKYWQTHEVGNLYDIEQQLGYLRTYDRRAKGIWAGTIVGGKIFGVSVPVLRGSDGKRSIVIDGVPYEEETASGLGKRIALALPASSKSKTAPTKAPKAAAKKTSGGTRKTKRS